MNCGYPQFAPKALDARVMPPDHEEGAETLLRVLELEPPPSLSSKALAFNDKEMSSVLEKMLGPSQQTIREDLVASCDWRLARGPPARVLVNILLKVTEGVNPDAYLREGVKALDSEGFKTAKGFVLKVTSYGRPTSLVAVAHVCRVITRSSTDAVRLAMIERGVPESVILEIIAPAGKDSSIRGNVVLVNLDPTFAVDAIPWKVVLQEPGYGREPRRVALQGQRCDCCRSADHKHKQCSKYKDNLCGRCGYPLQQLTDKGIPTCLHDCEGGPAGVGAELMDLDGSAWHQLQKQARAQLMPSAEADDPMAEARNASLSAARAAAEQALQGNRKSKKKRKRPRPHSGTPGEGYTPQTQQQRLEPPPDLLI